MFKAIKKAFSNASTQETATEEKADIPGDFFVLTTKTHPLQSLASYFNVETFVHIPDVTISRLRELSSVREFRFFDYLALDKDLVSVLKMTAYYFNQTKHVDQSYYVALDRPNDSLSGIVIRAVRRNNVKISRQTASQKNGELAIDNVTVLYLATIYRVDNKTYLNTDERNFDPSSDANELNPIFDELWHRDHYTEMTESIRMFSMDDYHQTNNKLSQYFKSVLVGEPVDKP